jgi:hypothetical protein
MIDQSLERIVASIVDYWRQSHGGDYDHHGVHINDHRQAIRKIVRKALMSNDEMVSETIAPTGREWFIIESSRKNAVFAPDEAKKPRGYIPRDAAEKLFGRTLDGNVWFTQEESDAMRSHPEWRNEAP